MDLTERARETQEMYRRREYAKAYAAVQRLQLNDDFKNLSMKWTGRVASIKAWLAYITGMSIINLGDRHMRLSLGHDSAEFVLSRASVVCQRDVVSAAAIRSLLSEAMGRNIIAMNEAKMAVEMLPESSPVLLTYGVLLMNRHMWDDAYTIMKSVEDLAFNEGNQLIVAHSYLNRGLIFWKLGRPSQSQYMVTQAVTLYKGLPDAEFNLKRAGKMVKAA